MRKIVLRFFILLYCLSGVFANKRLAANPADTVFRKEIITVHLDGKFYSTPIKSASGVIVAASHRKNIYFFDPSGSQINNFKARGWVHATPAQLDNGLIGIGSYDGLVYLFDEEGYLHKEIRPKGFIFTEPVTFGRYIVFGANKRLVFYDHETEILFHLRLKGIVHGSPMITSDSLLVIGSNGKMLYFINSAKDIVRTFQTKGWIMHSKPYETFDGNIIFGSYDKRLYSIDKQGNLLWSFKTEGRIHASPIQTPDSAIIFGSFDGNIYVLSSQGELINKIKTDGKVISSPTMVNDSVVVVGSYDKHLYFFTTKGMLIKRLDVKGKLFSSPIALAGGGIFCCTTNGILSFIPPECIFSESEFFKKFSEETDFQTLLE